MFILGLFVLGLVFAVSTPTERSILHKATTQVVSIVKSNISILWDKFNGVAPYELAQEDDDAFDDGKAPVNAAIGKSGLFEPGKTLNVKTKWDDGK